MLEAQQVQQVAQGAPREVQLVRELGRGAVRCIVGDVRDAYFLGRGDAVAARALGALTTRAVVIAPTTGVATTTLTPTAASTVVIATGAAAAVAASATRCVTSGCSRGGALARALTGAAASTATAAAAPATSTSLVAALACVLAAIAGIGAAAGLARAQARGRVVAVVIVTVVVIAVARSRHFGLAIAVGTLGASATSTAAAAVPATSAAACAVAAGGDGVLGGDTDDRLFGAEAEEAGLTLSDYVDVDLIAAQAQLIESPGDCLVDRPPARLRYSHDHRSSSIRSDPRRGPPRAG